MTRRGLFPLAIVAFVCILCTILIIGDVNFVQRILKENKYIKVKDMSKAPHQHYIEPKINEHKVAADITRTLQNSTKSDPIQKERDIKVDDEVKDKVDNEVKHKVDTEMEHQIDKAAADIIRGLHHQKSSEKSGPVRKEKVIKAENEEEKTIFQQRTNKKHFLPESFNYHSSEVSSTRKSQGGQDNMLWDTIFKDRPYYKSGFFIEFGARNGISESNSYFFENSLGWKGFLAEAIPDEQMGIANNRKNAAVIDGGICEEAGRKEFVIHHYGGWNGIAETYDKHRSDSLAGAKKVNVACVRLDTLLELFGVRRVNYMSVDTEGSELQALRSFPWDKVTVDVLGVEILLGDTSRQKKEEELTNFMKSKDYKIFKRHKFADDTADLFFVPNFLDNDDEYMYDNEKFESMKKTCQLMQRCL